MSDKKHILVTGATGYISGRLVPRLLDAGHSVRCLVRAPARLQGCKWLARVDVATGGRNGWLYANWLWLLAAFYRDARQLDVSGRTAYNPITTK